MIHFDSIRSSHITTAPDSHSRDPTFIYTTFPQKHSKHEPKDGHHLRQHDSDFGLPFPRYARLLLPLLAKHNRRPDFGVHNRGGYGLCELLNSHLHSTIQTQKLTQKPTALHTLLRNPFSAPLLPRSCARDSRHKRPRRNLHARRNLLLPLGLTRYEIPPLSLLFQTRPRTLTLQNQHQSASSSSSA